MANGASLSLKFTVPVQLVVDVLSEERDGGEKKERSGEEGRFARLVTSLLDTLQINLEGFNGKSIVFLKF
jgi:hypothetical protein